MRHTFKRRRYLISDYRLFLKRLQGTLSFFQFPCRTWLVCLVSAQSFRLQLVDSESFFYWWHPFLRRWSVWMKCSTSYHVRTRNISQSWWRDKTVYWNRIWITDLIIIMRISRTSRWQQRTMTRTDPSGVLSSFDVGQIRKLILMRTTKPSPIKTNLDFQIQVTITWQTSKRSLQI